MKYPAGALRGDKVNCPGILRSLERRAFRWPMPSCPRFFPFYYISWCGKVKLSFLTGSRRKPKRLFPPEPTAGVFTSPAPSLGYMQYCWKQYSIKPSPELWASQKLSFSRDQTC